MLLHAVHIAFVPRALLARLFVHVPVLQPVGHELPERTLARFALLARQRAPEPARFLSFVEQRLLFTLALDRVSEGERFVILDLASVLGLFLLPAPAIRHWVVGLETRVPASLRCAFALSGFRVGG